MPGERGCEDADAPFLRLGPRSWRRCATFQYRLRYSRRPLGQCWDVLGPLDAGKVPITRPSGARPGQSQDPHWRSSECAVHHTTPGDSNSKATASSRCSHLPGVRVRKRECGSADGSRDSRSLWSLGDRSDNACGRRGVVTDGAPGSRESSLRLSSKRCAISTWRVQPRRPSSSNPSSREPAVTHLRLARQSARDQVSDGGRCASRCSAARRRSSRCRIHPGSPCRSSERWRLRRRW